METDVICAIFDGHKVLMVQYSDYGQGETSVEGFWGIPGGRAEQDETPEQAVRREVFEETGLKINVVTHVLEEDVKFIGDGIVRHAIVFTCNKPAGELIIRLSDEHTAHRWVDISELDDYRLFSRGKAWILAAYTTISKLMK